MPALSQAPERQWLTNVRVATMDTTIGSAYGMLDHASLLIEGERIAWLGATADAPLARFPGPVWNGEGRVMTPGLIDCHTHLVYAGTRANEFELRLEGASYEQIAAAGGGIHSTVRQTRLASDEELNAQSTRRLLDLSQQGVTTVEIKSGYGLDLETERRILRAARELGKTLPVHVVTTFLGAHAVPPDFAGRPDDYLTHIIEDMLPVLHAERLIDAVDGFCEHIAFTVPQIRRLFAAATRLGLPVKLHAEQLSHLGGTALVAEFGGLSADHLEYATASDVAAMAHSGTVAVLLPVAYYALRETQLPPIDQLRKAGVSMAVASDCNPGTAPCTSLLLAMNMACTLFRLTPSEALAGVTRHAAQALNVHGDRGIIKTGYRADLALWDIDHPAELSYQIGTVRLHRRYFSGVHT